MLYSAINNKEQGRCSVLIFVFLFYYGVSLYAKRFGVAII